MTTPLLATAFWLAAAVTAPAAADPARSAVATPPEHFPIYLSADRAMVMLRIGAHPPVPVVFDTGASSNLLDLTISDQLGLPDTGASEGLDGQGTPVPGHQTRLIGASVGGVKIPETAALAASYDLPDEVGILSAESFPGRLVRVEPARARVTLLARTDANTPRCSGFSYSHDFSFDQKHPDDALPTAFIEVAGRRIAAEIDTGNNSELILPTSLMADLPLEAKPVAVGEGQSAVSQEPFYEGRLAADVTVAGVVLKRQSVLFAAKHKPNIGLGVLRRFTIVLDPTGRRDWLIPAGDDPVTCLHRVLLPIAGG